MCWCTAAGATISLALQRRRIATRGFDIQISLISRAFGRIRGWAARQNTHGVLQHGANAVQVQDMTLIKES